MNELLGGVSCSFYRDRQLSVDTQIYPIISYLSSSVIAMGSTAI